MTETSFRNNKASENLNNKLLEKVNDRGTLASYLMSPLSKNTNPGNTSRLKLVKDCISSRVNDMLIHNRIPGTLYNNLSTFRDTDKSFYLK